MVVKNKKQKHEVWIHVMIIIMSSQFDKREAYKLNKMLFELDQCIYSRDTNNM